MDVSQTAGLTVLGTDFAKPGEYQEFPVEFIRSPLGGLQYLATWPGVTGVTLDGVRVEEEKLLSDLDWVSLYGLPSVAPAGELGAGALVLRGLGCPAWRLEPALGLAGAQPVKSYWLYTGAGGLPRLNANFGEGPVADFPQHFADLQPYSVVVLADVPADALGFMGRQAVRQFVEAGGGLLVLGGFYGYGRGEFARSFLEDVLPVASSGRWDLAPTGAASALTAVKGVALPANLSWGSTPRSTGCTASRPSRGEGGDQGGRPALPGGRGVRPGPRGSLRGDGPGGPGGGAAGLLGLAGLAQGAIRYGGLPAAREELVMRTSLLWMMSLLAVAVAAGAAPDPALVGYWTGDEVSGIKVFDDSGREHPGFVYGDVQQVPGRVGKGLRFGPNDYLEVGSDRGLDLTDQFTIEFWFMPGVPQDNFALFARGGIDQSFDMYYGPPGLLNFRTMTLKSTDHVSGKLFAPDQWQHVAWTYDGNLPTQALKLYLNGELKQTWDEAGKLKIAAKPLSIGHGGALDEIRLYQRALSAEEVAKRAATPEAFVPAPVVVSQVWPARLLTRPGQKVALRVGATSLAAAPQTVKFRAFVETELDKDIPLQEATLTLAPGEAKEFKLDWDPGPNLYGFDLIGEVRNEQGQLLDRKSETFLVGRNPYQLGQYSSFASYAWDEDTIRRAKSSAVSMRRFYLPLAEYWCFNPDNFSKCAPDTDKWFPGMGATAYKNSEATTQAWISACHELGLGCVPYSISYASGYDGTRMAREHPEWMAYDAKGRLTGGVETQLLEVMTKFYQQYPKSLDNKEIMDAIARFPNSGAGLQISTVDLALREPVRFHAAQVAAGVKRFNWDGLRWDGHPQVGGPGDPITMGVPSLYDLNGKPLVPDDATRDRLTVENIRMVKAAVLKENPDAVFGYNWGLEYEKHGRVRPTDYAECCKDGGTILWESVNGIHDAGSPWHRWRDAADAIADEVEHPRQNGGFLQCGGFPWWLAAEPYGKHLLAAIFAARAHLFSAPGLDTNGPYLRFAARYAGLLYDPAIARSPEWAQAIQVGSDQVWWRKYVYERPTAGGKQVIVHLLNSPATEFVEIGNATPPTVQKDLKVTFTLPGGQAPQAVYLLSPDRAPASVKLEAAPQGGTLVVTVPELAYWEVVVVQF